MTDKQIKEMLNGIINNGEQWECRPKGYYCSEERKYVDEQCDYDACGHTCRDDCYGDWSSYKLGDEIHADWEYRKVEKWYVYLESDGSYILSDKHRTKNTIFDKIMFEGIKEECEKWIEEHTKKSWYEDYLKLFPKSGQKETCRIVCKEVCKKILEEVKKSNNILGSIVYKDVEDIIKDLGVEL